MQFLTNIGQSGWTYLWTPVLIWSAAVMILLLILKMVPKQYPQIHLDVGLAGLLALVLGVTFYFIGDMWPEAVTPIVSISSPFPFSSDLFSVHGSSGSESNQIYWLYGVGTITMVALVMTFIGILQLVTGHVKLRDLVNGARTLSLSEFASDSSSVLQCTRSIRVLVSEDVTTAFSTGIFQKKIVIPDSLADQDRTTVLVHEYNHLVNGDILRAELSHVCRALFFFHPLVHFLHKRSLLLSEIVCDQRTLQNEKIGPRQYANVLLRNAPTTAHQAPILALVHSPSQLKQRMMAMKNHISLPFSHSNMLIIGFVVLLMISVVVGCSDFELAPTEADIDPGMRELVMAIPAAPLTDKPFVIVEQMPVLIDGLKGIQQRIRYPDIAKQAGVQGRVFLQFVVDVDGNVVDPVVTRGIGAGCDLEAVRALSEAKFIPGVQRGQRVPVKMSIPVTFRLDGPQSAGIPPAILKIPDSSLPTIRPEDILIFDSFADVDFDYTLVLYKKSVDGGFVSAEEFRSIAADNRGYAIVRGSEINRDLVDPNISDIASEPGALFVIRRK